MSEYIKYQHVEKLNSDEVEGITEGRCYIFPKIDGTNAQVWFDGERVRCGSRNREIFADDDNQGFAAHVASNDALQKLVKRWPNFRFFGEWLVPHSLKTYNKDNWKKFYLFDVMEPGGDYLAYAEWSVWLEDSTVEYIPPLRILKNPKEEHLIRCLDENTYLIDDGAGSGEGIVIKNYSFVNKYGRQVWAKLVRNNFKTKNHKEFGAPESVYADFVEEKIVSDLLTPEIVDKVHAKILAQKGTGWRAQYIPQLLGTVYHDFVVETIWDAIKAHKNPVVDFKRLQRMAFARVKEIKGELF